MAVKVAINGFGRIGRLVLRALLERQGDKVEIVAINSPSSPEQQMHLLKYDSVHGRLNEEVSLERNNLKIGKRNIAMLQSRQISDVNWRDYGVDVVLECSGKFNSKDLSLAHITQGAKKVLVSAPCTNADRTICYGVNDASLQETDLIVSAGSCTTNALAPLAKILQNHYGIISGYMTTIHAYTGDQNHIDASHKDLRRARACAISMVPTKTGAASSLSLVIPELAGKLEASAIRVPTANVSMIDLVVNLAQKTTKDEVNKLMQLLSTNEYRDILGIAADEMVSVDFNHTSYSTIFDPFETSVVNESLLRVVSWYDNEWAFANRMLDVANVMAKYV